MTDELYAGDDTTGLLTHFVGRVRRSFWSTMFAETQGQANQDFAHTTMLFWQNDVLDILQANYSASGPPTESVLTSFGVGNGWYQTADEPNVVYHEDDDESEDPKRFHSSTAFMKFVHLVSGQNTTYEKAIVLDGDAPNFQVDLTGVRAIHAQNQVRSLRDATIWENMIFEYRGIAFPNRRNPDPKPRAMPIRFLGYSEDDIPVLDYSAGRSPSVAAAPAASALGELPADVAAAVPEDKLAGVERLWASAPSVDAFGKNVQALLRDDPDAVAAVGAALAAGSAAE